MSHRVPRLRLTAAIAVPVLAAAFAAPADASVVVYKCNPSTLCAVNPEGGKPRALVSFKKYLEFQSVTPDGSRFVVAFSVENPIGSRLVTGPTNLDRPVTDEHDTKVLKDVAPMLLSGQGNYGQSVFTPDASAVTYVREEYGPGGGSIDTLRRAAVGTDVAVTPPIVNSFGSLSSIGGRPFYILPNAEKSTTCFIGPGGACQEFAPGLGAYDGTLDGKCLFTAADLPGINGGEPRPGPQILRDAKTLAPVADVTGKGGLSPDNRFILSKGPSSSGNEAPIMVAPLDGSAPPREIAPSGYLGVWAGDMGSAATIAGSATPDVTAPKSVPGGSVRARLRVVVRTRKGTAIQAVATAGGKTIASKSVTAGSGPTVVKLKLTSQAGRRAKRARRVTVAVKVGQTFSFRRVVRVR